MLHLKVKRVKFVLLLVAMLTLSACVPAGRPPQPTPIPGFVGGEEKYAYSSFIEFYKDEVVDCHWRSYMEADIATFLDIDYQGIAVYIGNGIWRFHVQVGTIDVTDRTAKPHYKEEVVARRSLADRTWEDKCDRNYQDSRDYAPDPPR